MPSPTDIIDQLATPPLVALQQVLDTGGPYSGGDHVLDNFTTSGAFLLPAGTYSVNGVYGVVVRTTTIPSHAGVGKGFNGIVGGQDQDMDNYLDRIAQVCLFKSFPVTGAIYAIQTFDVHYATQLFLWPGLIGGPNHIGLHVFPNFAVDLYYMCVL